MAVAVNKIVLIAKVLVSNYVKGMNKMVEKNRLASREATALRLKLMGVSRSLRGVRKGATLAGIAVRALGIRMQLSAAKARVFKMELLGVMFFGMMLQGFFLGLLAPALEAVGAFDLLREALSLLFLDTGLQVMDWLERFINWVAELDPETKELINSFVKWGVVLGTFLFLFGAIGLGLRAVIAAFSGWWVAIKAVWFVMKGLGKGVWQVLQGIGKGIGWMIKQFGKFGSRFVTRFLGPIVGLIIGLWLAFKENFGNIRDWALLIWVGIKDVFGGVIDFLEGAIEFIAGIFTLNWTKIGSGFMKMVGGLWRTFTGFLKIIYGLLITLGLGALRFFKLLWDGFVDILGWIWSKFSDGIQDLVRSAWGWAVDFAKAFGNGIAGAWGWIWNGINKALNSSWSNIKRWFKDAFGNIFGRKSSSGDGDDGDTANDFIYRPGKGIQKFSPQDTVVGFKGGSIPGSSGGGVVINQTLNISVSDAEMMQRMIDDSNRKVVDDVRRLVRA